ncbi:hypothetical protein AVEN_44279-1 [Araneus ventricosus]|uniref:Uncharacterized protein n=1 Tax=Araneus ventricosus TaxID=182803 RepID=A0A4Y2RX92_ARAVE|nr:hypothetical protein AVEN_44279-1 [Araneus ventricosus]
MLAAFVLAAGDFPRNENDSLVSYFSSLPPPSSKSSPSSIAFWSIQEMDYYHQYLSLHTVRLRTQKLSREEIQKLCTFPTGASIPCYHLTQVESDWFVSSHDLLIAEAHAMPSTSEVGTGQIV